MEREKQHSTLSHGVSPVVHHFLLDCIKYKVVEELERPPRRTKYFYPLRNRNIIGTYFSSDVSTYELGEMYGVSRKRVAEVIKDGMIKMWRALPEEIRSIYDTQEIRKMKTGNSPRAIEKNIKARTGQPSPLRGIKRSPEKLEKRAQVQKGVSTEKPGINNNNRIRIPESALKNFVESYIKKQKKKKKSVTVDDICDHLQFLGVNFEQQQIINIVDR